jgi:hypothetical protein
MVNDRNLQITTRDKVKATLGYVPIWGISSFLPLLLLLMRPSTFVRDHCLRSLWLQGIACGVGIALLLLYQFIPRLGRVFGVGGLGLFYFYICIRWAMQAVRGIQLKDRT